MSRAYKPAFVLVVIIFGTVISGVPGYGSGQAQPLRLTNEVRSMALGELRIGLGSGGFLPRENSTARKISGEPKISSLYGRSFKNYSRYSLKFSGEDFSLGYFGMGAGNLLERDLQGEPTGQTFRYGNHGLSASIGGKIGNFGLGLQASGSYSSTGKGNYTVSLTPALDYRIKNFRAGVILPSWAKQDLLDGVNPGGSWKRNVTFGFGVLTKELNLGLDFTLGLEGDFLAETDYRAGVEWWVMEYFALRAGLNSHPEKSFGFGIKGGKVRIDYAYTFHSELPGSSVVSFGWVFG